MNSTSTTVDEVEIQLCLCEKYVEKFGGDIVEWTVVCKVCRARAQEEENGNVSGTS